MAEGNDSIKKTIFVAGALSVVCSIFVSTAATQLKPIQEKNRQLDQQRNILSAAGLLQPGVDIQKAFERIEAKVVDLDTGEYTDAIDAKTYNQRKAQKDPALSRKLKKSEDIATIQRRERYALIYIVRGDAGKLDKVILPIRGYGLWSTLRGYVAVEEDGNTIAGLTYYEHAETPGLGGEVDNPNWKALWPGKKLYDERGRPAIDVVKGKVDPHATGAEHKIDGLSGATITANGVENMFRYWLGEQGFAAFLTRLKSGQIS